MKTIRTLHRRLAIVMGVVFLAWVLSGILMVLPRPTPRALASAPPPPPDFSAVTLSPSAAIDRARLERGSDLDVVDVELASLTDAPVYVVRGRGRPAALVDAQTGDLVEVTSAVAERIARRHLRDDVGAARVERIEAHTPTYPWGGLPAWRLEFENGGGTIVYVAAADGAVSFTDWRNQAYTLVSSVHDFGILKLLTGVEGVHHKLVVAAGLLAGVLVVTGYQLVLIPPWRRRKSRLPRP